MTNLILCGGYGTRLWPLSRKKEPKQFIKLFNGLSLFQKTLERNKSIVDNFVIVSNKFQHELARKQLEEVIDKVEANYIIEPIARNTAPAIALACLSLPEDEIIIVSPSDHLIKDLDSYSQVVNYAESVAKDGYLVTFGIEPEYPETGYGYIEARIEKGILKAYDVDKFHEKPDLNTAQNYLESNLSTDRHYLWNSGMFCFRAGTFLRELKKFSSDIYEKSYQAFIARKNRGNIIEIAYEKMAEIPANSIDYAVMEKSDNVKVIPVSLGWSDLGSFDTLHQELDKDIDGNTKLTNKISINSHNNLVLSNKLVALIDVDDILIVETDDALLIAKQGSSQKIKKIVEKLDKKYT